MTDAPTKEEVISIATAWKPAMDAFHEIVVRYQLGERGAAMAARRRRCRELFQAVAAAYLAAGIDEELWCAVLTKAQETVALYESGTTT